MSESNEDLQELIADWDGLAVVARHDRPTGAWMFIALHDDTLGRPTGGTRMKPYPSPTAALRDAMRLAEGMTHKWAAVGVPFGGGKAVIAPPGRLPPEERRALLLRYGGLVDSLHGSFSTGEDLGTTVEDMAVIAEATRHVMGAHGGDGKPVDPGPFTARGVFRGIAAAVHHLDGGGLAGRTVLIQGVGDVGAPLARLLRTAGARLLLADLDGTRAAALAAELGGEPDCRVIPADEVFDTECDVYAPCAVGQVVNAETVPRLRCRAVAGSANNQLRDPAEDAGRLHRRGILYAPDYLINGGGALAFGSIELGVTDPRELFSRVEALGDSLSEIFAEAAERGESPLAATHRRVERVLADGPTARTAAATVGP
jgi:leucine dehydrogenase